MTVFGIDPTANVQWFNDQGAQGFTGLTLHTLSQNQSAESLTLAGYATSDLNNGRLSVQFGSDTGGTPYMHIIGTG